MMDTLIKGLTAKQVLDQHLQSLDCNNTEVEIAMYYRAIDAMEAFAHQKVSHYRLNDLVSSELKDSTRDMLLEAKSLWKDDKKLAAIRLMMSRGYPMKGAYDYCKENF